MLLMEINPRGGRCRPGYLVGGRLSALQGLCRMSSWSSKFTRKTAVISLGGEVYAFSDMAVPFVDVLPGMVGLEACDSLRRFPSTQGRRSRGVAKNVFWAPGA